MIGNQAEQGDAQPAHADGKPDHQAGSDAQVSG